jgi:signal transduction histidine kinase
MTIVERQNLISQMKKASERLLETIDLFVGFIKFDHTPDYAFGAVFLREILENSVSRYSEHIQKKNIRFSMDSGRGITAIVGDKNKIQFVFDMLLDNSIKYSPSGGEIKITIKQELVF